MLLILRGKRDLVVLEICTYIGILYYMDRTFFKSITYIFTIHKYSNQGLVEHTFHRENADLWTVYSSVFLNNSTAGFKKSVMIHQACIWSYHSLEHSKAPRLACPAEQGNRKIIKCSILIDSVYQSTVRFKDRCPVSVYFLLQFISKDTVFFNSFSTGNCNLVLADRIRSWRHAERYWTYGSKMKKSSYIYKWYNRNYQFAIFAHIYV